MEKRTYLDRIKITCCPAIMERYTNEEGAWYESEAEIAAGLAWGREKVRLLRWVRKHMRQQLTAKQRRCIELYYFENLTFAQVGQEIGCSRSSASRAVQRGLHRIRAAAKADPPKFFRPRRRRKA